MPVKVLDVGGGKVMLSSDDRAEVDTALRRYVAQGSKVIAVAAQVGSSWVAACTPPAKVERLDDTQSLRFAEFTDKLGEESGIADDELCRVETVGFKKIITGPTRVVVASKVDELKQFGAAPIGEVEEIDGVWTAMVDMAGAQSTGYRW